MSRKYTLLAVALVAALLALASTAAAAPTFPAKSVYFDLVMPDGTPFANQPVIIVVFNETSPGGNCILAHAIGTTDKNGRIWAVIDQPGGAIPAPQYGTYNISVFWQAYGKTFLAYTLRNQPNLNFLNSTLPMNLLWNLTFKAITNIGGTDVNLYFQDPESGREDIAYFEVWLYKKAGAPVFASEGNRYAISKKWFIAPTVEVDIKPTLGPTCYHIEKAWNVTLYKEVSWLISTGPGSYNKILVGRENVTLYTTNYLNPTTWYINITELIPGKPKTSTQITGDPLTTHKYTVVDRAYTFLARVTVQDPCGNTLTGWEWPPINVEFSSPTFGKVRVGKVSPGTGVAPEEGYNGYFWLPNISLFYNEKLTIAAEINGIQVFSTAFNTTSIPSSLSATLPNGQSWTYFTGTVSNGVADIAIRVGVVRAQVRVKDSGITAVQPLEGAIVIIEAPGYDPINTYTDGAGYVALPPYEILGGGSVRDGTPIIVRKGSNPGYLPVPFDFIISNRTYTYTFKVFYALPGTEYFVDVTPDNNKVELIPALGLPTTCTLQSFDLIAKVFNVNILVLDLCNRPITSLDDRNASLILTYTPPGGGVTVTFSAGLGRNGTTFLGKVPGGTFTVKLAFKGVLMDPVSGPSPLVVTGNIANVSQATYVFPVGDIVFRVTQWDVKEPLVNISATLTYYKGDTRMYVDGPKLTDCSGLVSFTKVPMIATGNTKVILELRTTSSTHYIRPQDAGLLVGKWDLTSLIAGIKPACSVGPIDVPAWIFSFTLEAVDHAGNILKELPTSNGTAPVIVALNDTAYGTDYNVTLLCVGGPGCLCWPEILVDYRIFNATGFADKPWGNGISEARFKFTSSQFMNSHYPHLFIAGANYSFIVWYGGVMVYNYTFTMPAPSEALDYTKVIPAQVILFNETAKTTKLAKTDSLDYTWILDKDGRIEHPIVRFYSAPAWAGRYSIKVQLVTWVINLDIYTLSKENAGLIPGLNVTLVRSDVVNWKTQLKGNIFLNVTRFSEYSKSGPVSIAWSAVDGNGDGVVSIPVAVWAPTSSGISTVKFGASITNVYVLAGKKYGTPGVPDTPLFSTISGIGKLYGYLVGPYNVTLDDISTDTSQSLDWYKFYTGKWVGPFRGPKAWIGGAWNLTLWSGAAKVVPTAAMEGFCVLVGGPDLRGKTVPMANQPVTATVIGTTGATAVIATGATGADGTVTFYPDKGATVSTPIGGKPIFTGKFAFLGITGLEYRLSTRLNFDPILAPYGLKTEDVMDPDTLSSVVSFTLDNNMPGGECVELTWSGILVTVFDWQGKPLQNMMVAAVLREPAAKALPSVIGFTDAEGHVILYVPPGEQRYQLLVYWRDSYLLRKKGVIPREIVIFDTVTDYDTPRLYAPGSGTTLETFVYAALIYLRNAEGAPLSPETLGKITVTIRWPDQVITVHTPESDGRVPIILNKATAKSWPLDASAARSPETDPKDISQAPHGAYLVTVEYAGVGKIAEQSITIIKGRFETPFQTFEVRLDIRDIKISFSSPFGTPLAGATVEITKPGAIKETYTLGPDGAVTLREVLPGTISFTVKDWKGIPVAFSGSAARAPAIAVTVPKIGKLTVKVTGARGQGVDGATVNVDKVGTFTTDASGVVSLELPSGSYSVKASKGGREASATATVADGKETITELKLDIFLTIAGWEMSSGEFLGLLLLLILLVLVIFIVAHEYAAWRRRRLARVIAPAGEQK
ncbi:MAG: carboxypeptidase-like regulatory domain-containing protein [Thermofilum sp.]